MKFVSSLLTLLLKIIFIVVFLVSTLISSILYTYLDESFYTHSFNEQSIDLGVYELKPEMITSIFEEVKNYDGEYFSVDIEQMRNIIEIETEGTVFDTVLSTTQYLLTHKLAVTMMLLTLCVLPLIAIYSLNHYPVYKGLKKTGTSIIHGALLAFLPFLLLHTGIPFLVEEILVVEIATAGIPQEGFNASHITEALIFILEPIFLLSLKIGIAALGIGMILYSVGMRQKLLYSRRRLYGNTRRNRR